MHTQVQLNDTYSIKLKIDTGFDTCKLITDSMRRSNQSMSII